MDVQHIINAVDYIQISNNIKGLHIIDIQELRQQLENVNPQNLVKKLSKCLKKGNVATVLDVDYERMPFEATSEVNTFLYFAYEGHSETSANISAEIYDERFI